MKTLVVLFSALMAMYQPAVVHCDRKVRTNPDGSKVYLWIPKQQDDVKNPPSCATLTTDAKRGWVVSRFGGSYTPSFTTQDLATAFIEKVCVSDNPTFQPTAK